jgi:hypothetical protein
MQYEARCCHPECNDALTIEIARVGEERAEDLCVRLERADDVAYYSADATYTRWENTQR